jgi:hypothetical protein
VPRSSRLDVRYTALRLRIAAGSWAAGFLSSCPCGLWSSSPGPLKDPCGSVRSARCVYRVANCRVPSGDVPDDTAGGGGGGVLCIERSAAAGGAVMAPASFCVTSRDPRSRQRMRSAHACAGQRARSNNLPSGTGSGVSVTHAADIAPARSFIIAEPLTRPHTPVVELREGRRHPGVPGGSAFTPCDSVRVQCVRTCEGEPPAVAHTTLAYEARTGVDIGYAGQYTVASGGKASSGSGLQRSSCPCTC